MKKTESVTPLTQSDNDIIDLNLGESKKRIRINGNDNLILYINTEDMLALDRFRETYPKLQELAQNASVQMTEKNGNFDDMTSILKEIDTKMREYIDYIFNANVSETCATDGSMYDPVNGQFRFEHILEVLFKLYSDNMEKEFKKVATRIKRHTDKYTNVRNTNKYNG